jgi:hypothetical protein
MYQRQDWPAVPFLGLFIRTGPALYKIGDVICQGTIEATRYLPIHGFANEFFLFPLTSKGGG